ncbi:PAP/OAS1 substrate-binding domain superfamily [Actinidia rufa]|uniref:PAP/OAS1 substrate-binding domain superfamily n=1 Tax=Actinidia rufa TaxID=165716 RepID=A0A7J0EBH9_9ERIC|nr:PAP/OAS1 substrate-binding domain superfamily [Actinidia rufa]
MDLLMEFPAISDNLSVFPFGSVPLKTYLPDGDIDLTSFGGANVEDALMNDVVSVLEAEENNRSAEFIIKDVQLIRAEVKLVKCIVQNIVVDISFNQLGGLCTLCFLEQVDRHIGKNHLFKRSIILIKVWCYYESRILGAHHGLISTYALEALVLYIFHLFHSTLNGPFAVLYRFLDYFSTFDWDNYCISLTGPVPISLLPDTVAEKPENGGAGLLLSNDFLRYCVDMFSIPKGVDLNSRTFSRKHLNIIDPLKENNNLGRSVSKGNFYRIRSAFTYGARKLEQILLQPEDNIVGEICQLEKANSDLKPANSVGINGSCELDLDGLSQNGGNNCEVSGIERKIGRPVNGHEKGSMKAVTSTSSSETDGSVNGTSVMDRFSGDAEDLASSRIQGLKISNGVPKAFHPSGEESKTQRGIPFHAPHLHFSGSLSGHGKLGYENSNTKELEYSGLTLEQEVSSGPLPVPNEEPDICVGHARDKNLSDGDHEVLNNGGSKDVVSVSNPVACSTAGFNPGYREMTSANAAGRPEYSNSVTDLTGDYDSHLNSLKYGQWCYEHSSIPSLHITPALPSQFLGTNPWNVIQHSRHFKGNGLFNMNANGVVPRPAVYHTNTLLIPHTSFATEEMPKHRGTGTYFPNMNLSPHPMPFTGRGRKHGPMRSPRTNGRIMTPMEAKLLDRNSRDLSPAQFSDQGSGKLGLSDFYESGSPSGKVRPDVNGLLLQPEGLVECGSVGHVPLDVPLPLLLQASNQSSPTLGSAKSKICAGSESR